ncbi:MAG: hypothetical protein JWN56_218 [Sphingobacteriales bacterium]|nr:hypothetical protein [Sphingobacteriales bacterium]
MSNTSSAVALIILAAGNSSRLGQPKQNLLYQNKTLLQHVVDEGSKANLHPIIVVEGSTALQVLESIHVVQNNNWEQGMGSSISTGVSALLNIQPETEVLILTVCDQPFISAELFKELIDTYTEQKTGIVASAYADTMGTPVLFTEKYFPELLNLKGKEGAKRLLQIHKDDISLIQFPKGNIDIDTLTDYTNLINPHS